MAPTQRPNGSNRPSTRRPVPPLSNGDAELTGTPVDQEVALSEQQADPAPEPLPMAETARAGEPEVPAPKPTRRTTTRRAPRQATPPSEIVEDHSNDASTNRESGPVARSEPARDVAALVARASGRTEPASLSATPPVAPSSREPARAEPAPTSAEGSEPAVSGPRRRRLGHRELWTLTVALVVVGALAGFLFARLTNQYTASAQVNGGPGSTPSQQLAVSGDQANRYVQTEVLFLLDPGVGVRVQEQLHLDASPTYSVRQVGNTSVLEVAATADSPDAAADVANAVVADYVVGWRARSDSQLAGQIETTESQLAAATSQMAQFSGDQLTPNEQAQLTAATTLAQQLQTQLNDLNAQQAAVQSDGRIVTEASADFAGHTSSTSLMTLLGALLGGLAAVGVWVWARRSRP